MTRMSWRRYAVPAVAKDGVGVKGGSEDLEKQGSKMNRSSSRCRGSSPAQVTSSQSKLRLDVREAKFDYITDKWIDSIPPPKYTQLSTATNKTSTKVENVFVESYRNHHDHGLTTSTKDITDNGSVFKPVLSSQQTPHNKVVRRRNESCSSTSTIFERSPTVPITIVVTTPEEESSPSQFRLSNSYFPGPSNRRAFFQSPSSQDRSFRSDSTVSLPVTSGTFTIPDRTRLMPPTDTQIDARKSRKAREFEEMRQFIIGFLNAKGETFPKALRLRVMSISGIRDIDLDPLLLAKLQIRDSEIRSDADSQDEGIVLGNGLLPPDNANQKDHLRILELAFQSMMPKATPNPHPVQDTIAANRRKRMTMPVNSSSLSIDQVSLSSLSSQSTTSSSPPARMSLRTHAKSKATLDSIINNHKDMTKKANRLSFSRPPLSRSGLKRNNTVTSLPEMSTTTFSMSQTKEILPPHTSPLTTSSAKSQKPRNIILSAFSSSKHSEMRTAEPKRASYYAKSVNKQDIACTDTRQSLFPISFPKMEQSKSRPAISDLEPKPSSTRPTSTYASSRPHTKNTPTPVLSRSFSTTPMPKSQSSVSTSASGSILHEDTAWLAPYIATSSSPNSPSKAPTTVPPTADLSQSPVSRPHNIPISRGRPDTSVSVDSAESTTSTILDNYTFPSHPAVSPLGSRNTSENASGESDRGRKGEAAFGKDSKSKHGHNYQSTGAQKHENNARQERNRNEKPKKIVKPPRGLSGLMDRIFRSSSVPEKKK